jgi:hypothetical protein
MTHIHWVARQNKLEIPNDEEEVNTSEIHKYDGQTHDPDTMVVPLTPKPTRKVEVLVRTPPTIASRREEDVVLKKWSKSWLFCVNGILETKTNDGNTTVKAPDPRTNPNTKEALTSPKPHTHPSHVRRSPRQGAVDHDLTSRRKHSTEEVVEIMDMLREGYS